MIAWLEGRLWQAIAMAAGVLAVVGVVFGIVSAIRLKGVEAERDRLELSIRAPVTGWAARLSQCHANVDTLEQARITQNKATEAYAKEASARVAVAETELQRVRTQHAHDARRIAALIKPLNETGACARMNEADRRILEILR